MNIWCAACSTGQEPYSVAIIVRESLAAYPGWSVRIIASDISAQMIARAVEARYNQFEINRGLPAPLLVKHFDKHGLEWQLKEDVRRMVEFRQINLAGHWPSLPTMDVIFIRNVLIYFDVETKRSILAKVRLLMAPDGYLFLGGAETTIHLDECFEQIYFDQASCYRLRGL